MRDLVRRRTHLVQDLNRITNRIGRLLECANVKLGSVASNMVGVSGRKMLRAMARGEGGPAEWAAVALGQLKEKEGELVRALNGRFNDHFRYLLTDLLNELDYLGKKVESLERHIEAELAEHQDVLERLCTIPGVSRVTAWTMVAEIGLEMSVFPDASHLSSWAGLCPANNESAGKRLGGRTRKGNRYLRRILVQAAWAIAHTTDNNFLNTVFFRTARRRGLKKAALAVAHRVLSIAYYIVRDGTVYRERGGDYYDRLHPEQTVKRLVARLENLGMQVELRSPRHAGPAATTRNATCANWPTRACARA